MYCFFIGHREASERIAPALAEAVEKHITEHGVTEFLVGHYGGFDGTYYPPGMEFVPRRFAIVKANQYAIREADYLIAYVRHPASNAKNLLQYAKKLEQNNRIHITEI